MKGPSPLERDHVALLSEADMGSCSPDLLVPELSSLEKGAGPLQELDPDICLLGSKGTSTFSGV